MKNIDVKSLLIGTLLASTIFLGIAAAGPTEKWNQNNEWQYGYWAYKGDNNWSLQNQRGVAFFRANGDIDEMPDNNPKGWQPFAVDPKMGVFYRRPLPAK